MLSKTSANLTTTTRTYENFIAPFYFNFIQDIRTYLTHVNVTEESNNKIKEFTITLSTAVCRFANPNYSPYSVIVQVEDNFNRIFSLSESKGNGYNKVAAIIEKYKSFCIMGINSSSNMDTWYKRMNFDEDSDTEPVTKDETATFSHIGWNCDGCTRENMHTRHLCVICPYGSYDLCDKCIIRAHQIHPNHPFLASKGDTTREERASSKWQELHDALVPPKVREIIPLPSSQALVTTPKGGFLFPPPPPQPQLSFGFEEPSPPPPVAKRR